MHWYTLTTNVSNQGLTFDFFRVGVPPTAQKIPNALKVETFKQETNNKQQGLAGTVTKKTRDITQK